MRYVLPSLVVLAVFAVFGCRSGAGDSSQPTTTPGATPTPSPPAIGTAATTAHGPNFAEDDVAGAFARASSAGKLVFVDAWAPWCHTCLSMQRDVLSKPALAAYEDRVVFVAVDTDREENAPFLAANPVKAWPTFFMIDTSSGAPLAIHPGSMSLDETVAFIERALASRDPSQVTDSQAKAVLTAHAAVLKGEMSKAASAYVEAARAAGPRRTEAILGGLRAIQDPAECVAFGLEHLRDVTVGGAAGDVAGGLSACAEKLPAASSVRTQATAQVKARLQELADNPAPGTSVDDRADVLAQLAEMHDAMGDKVASASAHEQRLKLLERDAAQATTPEGARVHDYARMGSYLALGRGDDAVKMLTERTQQLPKSYEAWARLASTLHKLGKNDDAEKAVAQAIALSYGTRRLRYLMLRADIAAAKKDAASEGMALQQLLDDGNRLPPALGAEKLVADAKERLARVSASKAP